MIGNLLAQWIRDLCECCWTGCDCGCIEMCPQRRNHDAWVDLEIQRSE